MVCSVFLLKMVAKPFLWGLPKYERIKNSKHSKRVPACYACCFQVPCPKMKKAYWEFPKHFGEQKEKNPNEICGDSRGKRADNGDLPLRYNHGFSLFGKLPCMVATIK